MTEIRSLQDMQEQIRYRPARIRCALGPNDPCQGRSYPQRPKFRPLP